MKRLLLFAVASLLITINVSAQEDGYYDDTMNEIAISVGYLSNSNWIDAFENVGAIIIGSDYENEKFLGPFSVEYFRHLSKLISVGGIFAYAHCSKDFIVGDSKKEETNNYFTLMPAMKFDWLRRSNIGLYSKIAAGATYRSEKYADDSSNSVNFNFQISLIGFEAGSSTIRAFVEAGIGEQGVVQGGVRCKF